MNDVMDRGPSAKDRAWRHPTHGQIEKQEGVNTPDFVNGATEKYLREVGDPKASFDIERAAEFVAVLANDLINCQNKSCTDLRALLREKEMLNNDLVDYRSDGIRYFAELFGVEFSRLGKAFVFRYVHSALPEGMSKEMVEQRKKEQLAGVRANFQRELAQRIQSQEFIPLDKVRANEYFPVGYKSSSVKHKMEIYMREVLMKFSRDSKSSAEFNILKDVGIVNEEGVFLVDTSPFHKLVNEAAAQVLQTDQKNFSADPNVLYNTASRILGSKIRLMNPSTSNFDRMRAAS